MKADPRFEISFGSQQFDPLVAQQEQGVDDNAPVEAWFVQFHKALTSVETERMKGDFGLRLTEFVPKLTYIERIEGKTVNRLRSDPLVRAVAPYTAGMKVAPTVRLRRSANDDAGDSVFLHAVLFDDTDPELVREQLETIGASGISVVDDRTRNGMVIVQFLLPSSSISDVSQLSGVRWLEPVPTIVDDESVVSDGVAGTAGMLSRMWELGLHGEGQIIGIIDNGPPDLGHCFFRDDDNQPGPRHRKVLVLRNARGTPRGDHSTFTAGCAAGDAVEAPGKAPNRGGAWAAKLVVGNHNDIPSLNQPSARTASSVLTELTAAADAGATIHSNSWHAKPQGDRNPAIYDLIAVAVDRFMWDNEDHLVLGSSGNQHEEQGSPGTAKNAVCVSAASANGPDAGLGDGGPGPTADGRRKPDLMTVGCGIHSAINRTPCLVGPRQACASSYATPFAAAAAALVRQYFVEGRFPSGSKGSENAIRPSGALLKAVLLNSTIATSGVAGYPSDAAGWGLVQLQRTLDFDSGPRRLWIDDVRNAHGLKTGDISTSTVRVEDTDEPLKVCLVWTEPPGTIGAVMNPVVNNLDLVVTSPTGDVYLGNAFADGESATGGTPDVLNNVELVLVEQPSLGDWKIAVIAVEVNVGASGQGFALAASGRLSR